MPSYLDRQISKDDLDAFGHRHYAYALRSLIELSNHKPPFSIGLLGGWGTGKSTIKELYINNLKDDAKKDAAGLSRSSRIHCITFNAWRFGGKDQDIKRALLRHVFLELGGDEKNLHDRLFSEIRQSLEEPKGWVKYTWETIKAWAMPLPALLLILFLFVVSLLIILHFLKPSDEVLKGLYSVAYVFLFSYLLKQFKSPPVAAHSSVTRIALPVTTAEQYEDLLIEQIAQFKAGKTKNRTNRTGKTCERLVVFVDDLDRLSAEEMVLGLDAVRTFMEIPERRLPKGLGLVFVISCDEAKVAQALAERRRQGDMPGAVFNQPDARRYLDRIFQFRLEIPPFPRQDMRQYAIDMLRRLPGIDTDLKKRNVTIEELVDRMIHVGVNDPRNAIQIINAFTQAWWIARKREIEELGTSRAGGLHDGAITKHPITLGALSAIKVSFPDFYKDLQIDPDLLHRFTDVMVRNHPIINQPLTTQYLLKEKYYKKRDGDVSGEYDLRPENRPLRQFLSSLNGVRWADSLQSFLQLSEDPITRKIGDKSVMIYKAFVSGDTQGVLEGFGRHMDTKPLSSEQGLHLYQIYESLRNETESRRINAARVIAEIVNRLPKNVANPMLGLLCRELEHSSDLRSQLGLLKIKNILSVARGDDQKAIAAQLVDDILTIDEDMRFRLETLQQPSIEEAIQFARETVSLLLPIRRKFGLEPVADERLLNWLVERKVRINDKDSQLSFIEFEEWMKEHDDHLLEALGDRYTNMLADELSAETIPDIDTSRAVERARKVFEDIYLKGEESRSKLCSYLTRYVGLELPDASQVAWELMVTHLTMPNVSQLSKFITTFVQRLDKAENNEEQEFNLEHAAQSLLTIVSTRLTDLDEKALGSLSELSNLWSKDDKTADLSCRLLKELMQSDNDVTNSIISQWTQRLLSELPIVCVKYIGTVFLKLDDSIKSKIVSQFQPIIATDNINKTSAARYKAFTESAPEEAWDQSPLKDHLDSVLPQIAARHNDPNGYLQRVFTAVVYVLNHASPNVLGPALHTLFENAKGSPKIFNWLLEWMTGDWPKQDKNLNPYNPTQIFKNAVDFAVAQPNIAGEGMLESLRDMLERGIVSNEHRAGLIKAACAMWTVKPDHVVKTFKNGFYDLSHEQTANLVDHIQLGEEKQLALLAETWTGISQIHDFEYRAITTNRILEKGMKGTEEEPDRGLRLWLDAQNGSRIDILLKLITQPEINDSNRKRLWLQVINTKGSDFNASFFLEAIPKILKLPSIDTTAVEIFENYDKIYKILSSANDRVEMSQRLMATFPEATTNTIKIGIAEWCKKLNGAASLKKLDAAKISPDDLEILKSNFGTNSEIRRLEKKIGD